MSVWAWYTASIQDKKHTPKYFLGLFSVAYKAKAARILLILSFWKAFSILRSHKKLTFDLNKNAYLVLVLQSRLKSHSDYRSLSSSSNVWISTERPLANHTPLPVQFSHSSSGAEKVSDCSRCKLDGKWNMKSVNGLISPLWWGINN